MPARRLLSVAAAVCFLLVRPGSASAQDEPPLLSHTYTYGASARFRITSPGTPNGAAAVLYLRINNHHTESYGAAFEAASATVTRDLETAPLPPFASITYWWTHGTADGDDVETEQRTFRYSDDRFDWDTASSEGVHLHWITGDRATMEQALDVAREAQAETSAALQTPQLGSVDVYVYPSQTDLVHAMQLGGRTWAGGVAYPELGVVLVGAPPGADGLLSMQRDIPHELTHLALYDALGPQGYAFLPAWLDEGLATIFEARPDPDYARAIDAAWAENALIPLSELCAPFSQDPLRARLSYAQSGSLVRYLRQQYGWTAIRGLLHNYADGQACNAGTVRVIGKDLEELDGDWRAWHLQNNGGSTPSQPSLPVDSPLLRDAGPWLTLIAALAAPGLMLVVVFALRRQPSRR